MLFIESAIVPPKGTAATVIVAPTMPKMRGILSRGRQFDSAASERKLTADTRRFGEANSQGISSSPIPMLCFISARFVCVDGHEGWRMFCRRAGNAVASEQFSPCDKAVGGQASL